MTPEEYEHHVAAVLESEGWDTTVTPYIGDHGLDLIGEREGARLGVQAKMYRAANRSVNAAAVMLTYGAGAYADCSHCMIATDGHLLPDANLVADKLGVEIRIIASVPKPSIDQIADPDLSFSAIWSQYLAPLAGQTLHRSDGSTNTVLQVDAAGVLRTTSRGKTQRIGLEAFRWTIERMLRGDTVLREDINNHCLGRASSGVLLILSAVPIFEVTG
jgi:hypothetical protein